MEFGDCFYPLNALQVTTNMNKKTVSCPIVKDKFTDMVTKVFDYTVMNEVSTELYTDIEVPKQFSLGLIIGPSGSGKSQLLSEFGKEEVLSWDDNNAIVSHFSSPEDAIDRLGAVGLNTIPSWVKPYRILSNGEKFRADLARRLKSNAVIDEFTSVIDRNVAKAAAASVAKYIRKNDLSNVVFASCHSDIVEWLEPDWVFNTLDGSLSVGRSLRRPEIKIELYEGNWKHWEIFKKFHYLDAKINKASTCYLAFWNDALVGFTSVLAMPSGTLKNAFRGHRTVILPDFQGLGIGVRLSDTIGQLYVDNGKRYYSRTAHPRMGFHRENSPKWKATSKNKKMRTDVNNDKTYNNWTVDLTRVCWSHEYIGQK